MTQPFCTITGTTNVINCSVNESHGASTSTAIIEVESTTLDIGDEIEIIMGDESSSGRVFTGYVKQIDKKTPTSTTSITANDKMVRAIEYYVVSSDPEAPFTRSKIQTEDLIRELLTMAGLTGFDMGTTYFQIANVGEVEVNLVSSYDYCHGLANLITWHLWCDRNGVIHFKNRKPSVMYGDSGQVGDVADQFGYSYGTLMLNAYNIISLTKTTDEKDLRNRIVVYGSGVEAEASAVSPYLPSGFYKTAVIGASLMLDTQAGCQQAANYNLQLYNRLTTKASCAVAGLYNQYTLGARTVLQISANEVFPSIPNDSKWYVYTCEHSFSSSGYITSLELRQ
jgi:hypothetical protein